MRFRLIGLVVFTACGGSTTKASDADCTAYAQRTAELMYVGFERGSSGMGKYIKPEVVAAFAAPFTTYCREHLPAEHARCVGAAQTAQDADKCALDPSLMTETRDFIADVVKREGPRVADLPATAGECRDGAIAVLALLSAGAPGTPMPTTDQIAALCVRDKWPADFVRCTAAKDTGCKGPRSVQPAVTQLVKDAQLVK